MDQILRGGVKSLAQPQKRLKFNVRDEARFPLRNGCRRYADNSRKGGLAHLLSFA
jgi:hypothetical protein